MTRMTEEKYSFKKKGNEEQFKINSRVLDHMQRAEDHLSTSMDAENTDGNDEALYSAAIQAHDEISQGKDLLLHRNKLIKLADMSETGWRTVQEYETHQLAENSDDEKRIQKAEMRATHKQKEEERRRSTTTRRRYLTQQPAATTTRDASRSDLPPGRKPGFCFACGKPGHWRADCMAVRAAESHVAGPSREQKLSTSMISPVGRLRGHMDTWLKSGCNPLILDVISSGYKLPFKSIPPSANLRNNLSARNDPQFVKNEIEKLLHLDVFHGFLPLRLLLIP